MTPVGSARAAGRRRSLVLASALVLQGVAAVFFVGDVVADLREDLLHPHSIVEALVTVALIAGIAISTVQLRRTLAEMGEQARALDTARGELARVVSTQFDDWGLTPAERDVGFLALKGLDVAEIAEVRGAAPGTVRAQLARIYAKSGVSNRAQFAAWFVEDLLDARTAPLADGTTG